MSSICLLSDDLINKIAAGEVIENPASVLKELIENAIDAQATHIEISMKNGGLSYISVSDDGIGMTKEDLQMSILRHATSKITHFDDLQKIQTMGFRGEALASIAAISKMKIESFKNTANILYVEGGNIIKLQEGVRNIGTKVEVRSLFYNVPVRKKFQRSLLSQNNEAIKIVESLSLGHINISFVLFLDDKKVLDLKAWDLDFKSSFELRIKDIFGSTILDFLHFIDIEDGPLKISGFIGSCNFFKKNKRWQYLFVNNRHVISSLISKAMKEGYGTRISESDHPIYILHLSLKDGLHDVNVHPQKKYIRLTDEEFIEGAFKRAVFNFFNIDKIPSFSNLNFEKEQILSFNENISMNDRIPTHDTSYEFGFEKKIREVAKVDYFSLVQYSQSLYVVNLRSLNSYLLFENLMKYFKQERVETQKLLIPITLDLKKTDIQSIENHLAFFLNLGFEIRILTETSIAIESICTYLNEDELACFFEFILEDDNIFEELDVKILEKKLLQKICKIAKSKKKSYTSEETSYMLEKLMKYEKITLYKEPIMIPLNKEDFIKIFSTKKEQLCLS